MCEFADVVNGTWCSKETRKLLTGANSGYKPLDWLAMDNLKSIQHQNVQWCIATFHVTLLQQNTVTTV